MQLSLLQPVNQDFQKMKTSAVPGNMKADTLPSLLALHEQDNTSRHQPCPKRNQPVVGNFRSDAADFIKAGVKLNMRSVISVGTEQHTDVTELGSHRHNPGHEGEFTQQSAREFV